MDVRDYLARLQLAGAPAPDLDTLKRLHERHQLIVPFENLDLLAALPVSLDEASALDKIVARRRGGICYELNVAFAWLLRELGYEVSYAAGDVPRSDGSFGIPGMLGDHMALIVTLDEPWLCDVGFGVGFRHPLRLADRDENRQFGELWRLRDDEEGALLVERHERRHRSWLPIYRIDPSPRQLAEFEGAAAWHASDPDAPFLGGLVAISAIPDGRVRIGDEEMEVTRRGRAEVGVFADLAERDAALRRFLGLEPVA